MYSLPCANVLPCTYRKEYRRELPRRVYARLDDIEPFVPGPEDQRTFVLDAVDSDWKGFDEGGLFDSIQAYAGANHASIEIA